MMSCLDCLISRDPRLDQIGGPRRYEKESETEQEKEKGGRKRGRKRTRAKEKGIRREFNHSTVGKPCNWPRPPQDLRGLSGPGTPEESKKSPERVPWGRAPKVPKECTPESQKSPKRAQKSGFRLFSDSFETPGRTLSGLLGRCPGYSFRTLFGLFWGSRARRAPQTVCGRGQLQGKPLHG